jgi:hypothetical protein
MDTNLRVLFELSFFNYNYGSLRPEMKTPTFLPNLPSNAAEAVFRYVIVRSEMAGGRG